MVSVAHLPVVAVIGSGKDPLSIPVAARAAELGEMVARLGAHLLTGGGAGVMAATARAFVGVRERRGLSIGVLPGGGRDGDAPPGYPNPWVELAIRTHLHQRGAAGLGAGSRNHVNVLTAHVVVALPGGSGTATEVELARHYGRPLVWGLEADTGRERRPLADVAADVARLLPATVTPP